jgi:fermentation-respiration switch protein FrsA (DUF1100 family)
MTDQAQVDYSILDRPEVLQSIFHPRPEYSHGTTTTSGLPLMIQVSEAISIGACFHVAQKSSPNILFFHGNGEIVADYNDLGPMYNQEGINFFPVDYRGYGRSGGQPSVSAMMTDCHTIFDYTKKWLEENNHTGPLVVMGRSLGSASAIELAATRSVDVAGLIVESGFAYAGPLLKLLGIRPSDIRFEEDKGFRNINKISLFQKPTLIIHAEFDHIIPFSDGNALFDASLAEDKKLLKIPEANHNDIFARALFEYLAAIKGFCGRIADNTKDRRL